jgi:hypothetical protein
MKKRRHELEARDVAVDDLQHNHPTATRLAFRADEVAAGLGVSTRTLQRELSAGRFPAADLTIGKMPLWTVATVRAYLEGGRRR